MRADRPLVKICGITSAADAVIAAECGADFIGMIFAPSPRRVSIAAAQEIVRALSGRIPAVGVFVNEAFSEVNRVVRETGISFVQLHGEESDDYAKAVTAPVIRTIRVRDAQSLSAREHYSHFSYILYDTYVAGYGGAGVAFDWSMLKDSSDEFFLAGGITAENVAQAVASVHPLGIDVSSGVESSPGKKDPEKIARLIRNARA